MGRVAPARVEGGVPLKKKSVIKQCEWRCPLCHRRCGGVVGHSGAHQCPEHFESCVVIREFEGIVDDRLVADDEMSCHHETTIGNNCYPGLDRWKGQEVRIVHILTVTNDRGKNRRV